MYTNNDIFVISKTDFSDGLYCCVEFRKALQMTRVLFQYFNKKKLEFLCNSASLWPLVQLWLQRHSYHYSCDLYLRKLSAPLPLIMLQCDESGPSHYHTDLVFILNICCFHLRRTDCLFPHIICYKGLPRTSLDVKNIYHCPCVTTSASPSLHFSLHNRRKHVVLHVVFPL